jgi:hypothetical protein
MLISLIKYYQEGQWTFSIAGVHRFGTEEGLAEEEDSDYKWQRCCIYRGVKRYFSSYKAVDTRYRKCPF